MDERRRYILSLMSLILFVVALGGAYSHPSMAAESLTPRAYLPAVVAEEPPPVSVLNTHSYFYEQSAYSDYLHVVGEIRSNKEAEILTGITVYVDLLDAGGAVVETSYDSTIDLDLPPDEKRCFHVTFANPPDWDDYTVRTMVSFGGEPWLDYTVLDSQSERPYPDGYHIEGNIRNDDPADVVNPWVLGTLYAADGTVLGCRRNWITSHAALESGESAPFEVFFNDGAYDAVASYRIQLAGERSE